MILLASLLALDSVASSAATEVQNFFMPGVTLLTQWLAVFFVPILVALPLAPLPKGVDAGKCALVLVAGFFGSILSAAFIANTISGARGSKAKTSKKMSAAKAVAVNPFTGRTQSVLGLAALGSGVLSCLSPATAAFRTMFGLSVTLLGFCFGQQLPTRIKAICHPLLTATTITLLGLTALAKASSTGLRTMLQHYMASGGSLLERGGGALLLSVLGPCIVSFAFQMYSRWNLVKENAFEVIGTCFMSSVVNLLGTALLARALQLTPALSLVLIPRTITAPLAIEIAKMLGSDPGLSASVVSLTGLLGANAYNSVFALAGVTQPVARGLAVGAAAHGIGSAAIQTEPEAFSFAALAMALVGIFSTLLISISPFRRLVISIASGGAA